MFKDQKNILKELRTKVVKHSEARKLAVTTTANLLKIIDEEIEMCSE